MDSLWQNRNIGRIEAAVHNSLDGAEVVALVPAQNHDEQREGYWERAWYVTWRRPIPEGASKLGTDGFFYGTHRVHVNSDGESACFMGHYDQKRNDALTDMLERAKLLPVNKPITKG